MKRLIGSLLAASIFSLPCGPAIASDIPGSTKMVWSEDETVFVRGECLEATDIIQGTKLATNDAITRLIDYISMEVFSSFSSSTSQEGTSIKDEVRIHSQGRLQGLVVADPQIDRLTVNDQTRYRISVVARLPESELKKERTRIQKEQAALAQAEFDRKLRERRDLEDSLAHARRLAKAQDKVATDTAEQRKAREIAALGTPWLIPWDARHFPNVAFGELARINGSVYRRSFGPLNWSAGAAILAGGAITALSITTNVNKVYTMTGGVPVQTGTTQSMAVDPVLLVTGLGTATAGIAGLLLPQWNAMMRLQ